MILDVSSGSALDMLKNDGGAIESNVHTEGRAQELIEEWEGPAAY